MAYQFVNTDRYKNYRIVDCFKLDRKALFGVLQTLQSVEVVKTEILQTCASGSDVIVKCVSEKASERSLEATSKGNE
jgi:hypothetical protein